MSFCRATQRQRKKSLELFVGLSVLLGVIPNAGAHPPLVYQPPERPGQWPGRFFVLQDNISIATEKPRYRYGNGAQGKLGGSGEVGGLRGSWGVQGKLGADPRFVP